jgi:preprotein translocase subunit SecF
MFILKYKKVFLGIAAFLMLASVAAIALFRLNLGIEYIGGSFLRFTADPAITESVLNERLSGGYDGEYTLQSDGDSYTLRTQALSEENRISLLEVLSAGQPEQVRVEEFTTVGPTLGSELRSKAVFSIALVVFAITLYIAYAFRYVSAPVSSWKYGFVVMISLLHDILITVGVFAVLGHFLGTEIDSLFLSAILVILGYSINDTVVVFDRIRENLGNTPEEKRAEDFERVVGDSLSQTFVRSINTSVTVIISLIVVYVMTPPSIQQFALALLIGMASGAYSSLFVASPLLTYFNRPEKKA